MSMRPHDLLWMQTPDDLQYSGPCPPWLDDDWLAQAPVVVRREQVADAGLIPVGVRGRQRHERLAAYLATHKVVRQVTPQMLAQGRVWSAQKSGQEDWRHLPCIAVLEKLANELDAQGLPWGICGSVGFALATGLNVLRAESDVDVLIRTATPLLRRTAADLLARLRRYSVRIDVQVDTGHGGFALAEWASGRDRLLLKTAAGPLLLSDPWAWSLACGITPP